MRISDWSSDVCSSDLAELHLCRMMNLGDEVAFDAGEDEAAVLPEAAVDANHRIEIVEPRGFVQREIACAVDVAEHVAVRPARHQPMAKTEILQCRPLPHADRKQVVAGKSVPLSEDLA